MVDRTVHLPQRRVPHTEDSVTCPIWITQSSLDGMHDLLTWLEGYARGAQVGTIPGFHETTMFYRTLQGSIHKFYRDNPEAAKPHDPDEFAEATEAA